MRNLNDILNSSGAGNTILMVSASDLKDYTDTIIERTRQLVEEQHQPRFFTMEDMMERFSVSRTTVYNWMTSGKIRGYKMEDGGRTYFDQAEVRDAIKRGVLGRYIHK